MARLRELCQRLPREAVLVAMEEMSEEDQAIVRRMLDDVQPPAAMETMPA
jgi:N-methylhydantoinase B/oxoprolinase/acetone carboxylase alpha subunit